MVRARSRIARFLFCALTCIVIGAIFASELPEQLTLTNDTSNDYALRSPLLPKRFQTQSSMRQGVPLGLLCETPLALLPSSPPVARDCPLRTQSLFLLHSVLRT